MLKHLLVQKSLIDDSEYPIRYRRAPLVLGVKRLIDTEDDFFSDVILPVEESPYLDQNRTLLTLYPSPVIDGSIGYASNMARIGYMPSPERISAYLTHCPSPDDAGGGCSYASNDRTFSYTPSGSGVALLTRCPYPTRPTFSTMSFGGSIFASNQPWSHGYKQEFGLVTRCPDPGDEDDGTKTFDTGYANFKKNKTIELHSGSGSGPRIDGNYTIPVRAPLPNGQGRITNTDIRTIPDHQFTTYNPQAEDPGDKYSDPWVRSYASNGHRTKENLFFTAPIRVGSFLIQKGAQIASNDIFDDIVDYFSSLSRDTKLACFGQTRSPMAVFSGGFASNEEGSYAKARWPLPLLDDVRYYV